MSSFFDYIVKRCSCSMQLVCIAGYYLNSWWCLREQGEGVPEKDMRLVKDTYEDARTQVKTSIGVTG